MKTEIIANDKSYKILVEWKKAPPEKWLAIRKTIEGIEAYINGESIPVEKPVGVPSETLSCEPKAENPFTDKFFDWVDKYIKEQQLKSRIKECEYWRDQIFAPEFSSMKVITLFDFSTRLAELEASKS